MSLTTLIIAALATWEILEIWHHSSIMAGWRATTELWEGRLGELVRCPFCLAPYTALACLLALAMPEWVGWPGLLPAFVVSAFAVARLSNFCNDVGWQWCRTVRHDSQLPPPPAAPDPVVEQPVSSS